MQVKYVRFDRNTFVLFSPHIEHAVIAEGLGRDRVRSAGFVLIGEEEARCYGESIGLSLSSRKEDSKLMSKFLGLH